MTRARSVLLAALIVCSAVVGTAGPALAQTATDSGPVSYQYDGSPETLVIDTSALETGTEFSVEYTTQGGPSTGTTVLARETFNTANLNGDELWFYNEGAYGSVNVTVSGYTGGEPAFESRGVADSLNLQKTVVGSTGGDSDLTCDLSERLGTMTGGYQYLDCTGQPGTATVNTTGTDNSQLEIDMYQTAENSKYQSDNYLTTLNNYLEDTSTQAKILGKNAYIKSLNNGSSKSAAKTAAKQAVADYYATKQQNLINQWQSQTSQAQYIGDTANSEGIRSDYLIFDAGSYNSTLYDEQYYNSATVTLVNGTSATVTEIDSGGTPQNPTTLVDSGGSEVERIIIDRPNSNYNQVVLLDSQRYQSAWTQIETQNTNVQNQLGTLVDSTYSAYQQGEINNSDLVDPYVLANERSAGDNFETWSAAQLTLLGQNTPDNMDSAGEFEITTSDGTTYEGILTSPSNPTSGQFEADTTYNTADIDGSQMVITEDRIVELDGQFTLGNITTSGGENVQNATIQKVEYQTTNVTELKQQYEDLAYRRAQIEAREQALKQAGGGGFLGGESVNTTAAIVIVALVLLLGINN